jgi:transcriptional regulator with XRE-family HTH domain
VGWKAVFLRAGVYNLGDDQARPRRSRLPAIWPSLFSERTTRLWGTMPQNPPELSIALTLLRTVQGWSQKELSEASGVPGNLLSDYERGRKPLSRERLETLLSILGLSGDAVDQALAFVRLIRVSSPPAGIPGDAQRRRIEIVASEFGARSADFARWALTRLTTAARAEEERQDAEAIWARLKTRKPPERRRLVEGTERFRSWALCELVCKESVDAARDSADRALDLADLALRIAELVPGDEAWRSRVQGYAWAHMGNARRVKGDLPGADEAFRRAGRLWLDGASAAHLGLLDESYMFALEASLRREQRLFSEALELLDKSLQVDQGQLTTYILLSKAKTLEDVGDFVGAVTTLRRATLLLESSGDLSLRYAVRFNTAVNLCFLGRYKEAEELLPELRKLAALIENGLDLVRFFWLEGRVAAGLGDRAMAIAKFSVVRQEFATREIPYDTALVSLELAAVYLEEGQNKQVPSLAQQMLWIFQTQRVHREALAALKLFCEAVEQRTVTLGFVQSVLSFLRRAERDPSLRFEETAGPAGSRPGNSSN